MIRSLLAVLLCLWGTAVAEEPAKRIALTYDDAPRADAAMTGDARAAMLIDGLAKSGVEQAAFFITTRRIDSPERLKRIQSYAAAGHVLANHSHTHPWLRDVSPEDYLADIDRAAETMALFGNTRPWFRFPYLNEAPTIGKRDAVRASLEARGLQNGYVTVDTYDWHLEQLYQRALKNGQPVCLAALSRLYTDMMVDAANFFDQASRAYLERVPAQILLLHENDIAALFVEDLVAALEADGWEIITADEAYADPISGIEPETTFLGMGRVAALTRLAGKPGPEFTFLAVEEDLINSAFEGEYDILTPCAAE